MSVYEMKCPSPVCGVKLTLEVPAEAEKDATIARLERELATWRTNSADNADAWKAAKERAEAAEARCRELEAQHEEQVRDVSARIMEFARKEVPKMVPGMTDRMGTEIHDLRAALERVGCEAPEGVLCKYRKFRRDQSLCNVCAALNPGGEG